MFIDSLKRKLNILKSVILNMVKGLTVKFLVLCTALVGVASLVAKKAFKVARNSKAAVISIVVAIVTAGVTTVSVAGLASSVAVSVNGKVVGHVADFDSAALVEDYVKSAIVGDEFSLVSFNFEENITFEGNISSVQSVGIKALKSIDGVRKTAALYVDGVVTAIADDNVSLEGMLAAFVESNIAEGMTFMGYGNKVEIKDAYVYPEKIGHLATCIEDFYNGKTGVKVLTSRVESYDEVVPFETEYKHDNTKTTDYSYTVKKGKDGMSFVTANVTYINGKRHSADVITMEITKEPKSAKVVVGISDEELLNVRRTFAAENDEINEVFDFPCEITEDTYISSYWGDGRNHKGVDIASTYGSDIYAVTDGTVSVSGYHSEYGYYIVVDHNDGVTKSLYAHCSRLLVKKGQEVKKGENIAKIGSTGKSSGNHLHFSLLKNDRHINPALYIGLAK